MNRTDCAEARGAGHQAGPVWVVPVVSEHAAAANHHRARAVSSGSLRKGAVRHARPALAPRRKAASAVFRERATAPASVRAPPSASAYRVDTCRSWRWPASIRSLVGQASATGRVADAAEEVTVAAAAGNQPALGAGRACGMAGAAGTDGGRGLGRFAPGQALAARAAGRQDRAAQAAVLAGKEQTAGSGRTRDQVPAASAAAMTGSRGRVAHFTNAVVRIVDQLGDEGRRFTAGGEERDGAPGPTTPSSTLAEGFEGYSGCRRETIQRLKRYAAVVSGAPCCGTS